MKRLALDTAIRESTDRYLRFRMANAVDPSRIRRHLPGTPRVPTREVSAMARELRSRTSSS